MPSARRWAALLLCLAALGAVTCGDKGPTQPSCTYTLSSTSFSMGAAGGSGTVSIATGTSCAWSARADAGWLSITGAASGTGPGSAAFTVAENTGTASRSGTLTIADHQVTVSQQGAPPAQCTYDISPTSGAHTKDAGTGSFSVTAGEGCPWTAATSASWVTIAPGSAQGTGNATIAYSVERNNDIGGRTATIAVAGKTFTVMQSGDLGACQYSVAPVQFSPCMLSTTMTATISTQAGCPWTAASTVPWLTVLTRSGSGTGAISFMVTDNYDPPRSGVVEVRWDTPTAGQNLQVAQAGCYYSVTKSSIAFGAAGGSDTFDVYQMSDPNTCGGPLQNACVWTATVDVSWITIRPDGRQAGDQRVYVTVAPNTTGAPRSGHITVKDKVVLITQSS